MSYANVGDKMQCEKCKRLIYQFVKPVEYGDEIKAEQFKGINGNPSPQPGDALLCPSCNSSIFPEGHYVVH